LRVKEFTEEEALDEVLKRNQLKTPIPNKYYIKNTNIPIEGLVLEIDMPTEKTFNYLCDLKIGRIHSNPVFDDAAFYHKICFEEEVLNMLGA